MSLTKAILQDKAKVSAPELLGEYFGKKVYVRTPSELRRSRRASMMFGHDGKVTEQFRVNSRCYDIIDAVCDKDGKYLFTDADLEWLSELDAFLLDDLVRAISKWVDSKTKNE